MYKDNINFNLYKIFYEAANSKTIHEVADKLYVSQPAITRQIKILEEELKTTLFYRDKNGITLTPGGERLLELIAPAYNTFLVSKRIILENNNFEKGTIKIGAPTHITKFYLLNYIEKFKSKHPFVTIKIYSGSTKYLLDELLNHKLDFVIDSSPINVKDINFVIECIKKFESCFIASNKVAIKIKGKNISEYNFILPHSKSSIRKILIKELRKNNITINIGLEVDTTELIIEAVKSNIGVGYVIKEAVKEELKSKILEEIKTEFALPYVELNLIYVPKYMTNLSLYFLNNYLRK